MKVKNIPTIVLRLIEIVLVAGLYYLTARLGFRMALPPGNVTVLWPPSGLALAAVYILGWQMGIGIFIGSFAANIGTISGTGATSVSVVIAAGSTMQAWLGVWTLKRFIKEIPPTSISETLKSIAIMTLTSLTASAIGVTSLCLAGFAQWSNSITLALTWWLGDLIGILVFAPTLIILFMRLNKQKVKEIFLWLLTCLLVGISLLVFFVIGNIRQQQISNNLRRDTDEIVHILEHSFNQYIQNLYAIRSFYNSSQTVTDQEFNTFVRSIQEKSVATSGLEFVPRVTGAERAAYEQSMRAQGYADFSIYEKDANGNNIPAADRAEYFPVTLIYPFEPNKAAFGFDLGSDPTRLETINEARDSGQAAATAPIRLVQEVGDQPGLLIILPVYRNGAPTKTVEERRANLTGMTLGVYRVKFLVENALENINRHDVELYFYDVEDQDNPQFMFFSPSISGVQSLPSGDIPDIQSVQTASSRTNMFEVAGRTWLLITRPGPDYTAGMSPWLSWTGMLLGLIVTATFLGYVKTRQKNEAALVRSEAEFRAMSDHALTGVARYKFISGRLIYANEACVQMFGFDSPEAAQNQNVGDFVVNRDQIAELAYILREQGQVRSQELEIRSRNGEIRHLLYSAALFGDTVNVTLVDLTDRIRAGQEFRQLSSVVMQMADSVVVTGIDGTIEYVNPAFEHMSGYRSEEVVGKTPRILKSGFHSEEFYQNLWNTILRGEVFQAEIVNRRKNGNLLYETKTITPLRDANGTLTHFVATGKDITESKKVEEALEESEGRFRALFTSSNAIMLMIEPDSGRIVDANPAAVEFYGYSHSQLVSMNIGDINQLPPEQVAKERQKAKTEQRNYFIFPHRLANGEVRTVEVRSHPITNKNEILLFSIVYDVTEREKNEKIARQQSEQMQILYEASQRLNRTLDLKEIYQAILDFMLFAAPSDNLIISDFDPATKLITCDAYWLDNHWLDVSDLPSIPLEEEGKGTQSIVIRSGKSMLIADYQAQLKSAKNVYYVDGETDKFVEEDEPREDVMRSALIVPIKVGDVVTGVIQVMSDKLNAYTEDQMKLLEALSLHMASAKQNARLYAQVQAELNERKLAEEALRTEQLRFVKVSATVPGVLCTFHLHPDGILSIPYASQAFEDVYGLSTADVSENIDAIIARVPQEEVARMIESISLSARTMQPWRHEYQYQHPLKGMIWIEGYSMPVHEADGSIFWHGIATDITERKLVDEKLRRKEAEYRLIADNTADVIWILDMESERFTYVSPSVEKLRGFTPEEVMSQPISEALTTESFHSIAADLPVRLAEFQKNPTANSVTSLIDQPHKNGSIIHTEATTSFAVNKAGKLQVVGITRDISERKAAEEIQRQQREQLEYHYELVEILTSISTRFINLPVDQVNAEIANALKQLGEFEEVDRSYLFLINSEDATMTNTHEWCAPGVEPEIENLKDMPISIVPWWMEKMERGEEVHIPSVSQLPPGAQSEREILELQGIQSLLAVPLISNNQLVGFIGFDAVTKARVWDPDSILLIKMMADIISNALKRKATEESLLAIEKRNSALIQNAPDGIALINESGEFQFVSPSGYRMFDYNHDDVIEKNGLSFVHPADRAAVMENIRVLRNIPGRNLTLQYRFQHKDGSYHWVETTFANLLNTAGVNAIVLNFRDVTEPKQASLLQETVYRIAEAAQGAESLQDLYPQIHHQISNVMYADNFYIALYEKTSNLLRFVYSVDEVDELIEEPFTPGKGLTEYVLRSGKSLLCDEARNKELISTNEYIPVGTPSKIWLGVPLIAHGETIGVMAVQHYSDAHAFTEREQHILEFVSSQIATAIDRKQASEMLKKSRANLETAQSIARLGSWELEPRTGAGLSWSQEMYRLFHRNPARGVPHLDEFMKMVHPEDRQPLLDAQEHAIESGALVNMEYRAFPIGHEMRYFKASLQAVRDENGLVHHMASTVLDITESRLMELEIKERVKELTCLFRISRLLENRQANIETVCDKIIEHLIPAMQFPKLTAPVVVLDDQRYTSKAFNETLTNKLSAKIEVNGGMRGNLCVYYTADEPFIIPEEQDMLDNIARMLGLWLEQRETEIAVRAAQHELEELNRDLEKRVEERTAEVRRNEATYRALFENSNDGIFLLTPQGEDVAANPQALKILGYTAQEYAEVVRNDRNAVAAPNQHTDADARFATALRGDYVPLYERTFIGKNGKRVEVEINLSPVRDQTGKIILVQSVARDISDRKKAREALQRSEASYRALFENANDAIFLINPNGTIQSVNARCVDLLGYAAEEMIGMNSLDFIVPTENDDAYLRMGKLLAGERIPVYERRFIRKDGEQIETEINLSLVFEENGQPKLMQSVVRDITERKKAQEALRISRDKLSAANAALEKASRLKDEFLASMSHELRTPLTGILGLSEAMQLQTFGALNEKQLRAVRNIESSGRHLLELINDILDLSKIEAGKLDMQFEPCSVGDICQASLQLVKGMAHQKRINISFSMGTASVNVRADSRRLKQMLVNLFSNAIKFTPEEGKVGLDVVASDQKKAVFLSVWDKGIGIKPEDMEKLFKPFTQLDSSLARQYSGTGLGLSLVQRMAELHGGSIKVESVPGEGSRFTIILPWSSGVTQPIPGIKLKGTGPLKNTLVIEDNNLDAEHITRYLKELGIPSIIYPILKGALQKAETLHPSVILLDLNMPDGFGLELLTQLKGNEQTRGIPVIITSVEERRAEAMKLGAVGYLLKPFGQQDLQMELAKAAAFSDLSDPVMVIGARTASPLVMVADDNEMIIEMLSDFLISRKCRVYAVRSGFELIERAPELHPDIILVDIQMPGLDGMETMRRIRAHSDPQVAGTPIIAVTALAMSGDREKCLQAGANEYMSKPVVLAQLIEKIQHLINRNAQ